LIQRDLLEGVADLEERGAWKFVVHPDTLQNRWETTDELSLVLANSVSSIGRGFPQRYPKALPREWGISGGFNGMWGLSREGLFLYWGAFGEDLREWNSPYGGEHNKGIAPGDWLGYEMSLYLVAGFFDFARRFAHQFEPDTQFRVQVQASNLRGRHLLSQNIGSDLAAFEFDACVARMFNFDKTVPAGRLEGGWKEFSV
jgi:hypothetical protein